jgi:uncharacterized protein
MRKKGKYNALPGNHLSYPSYKHLSSSCLLCYGIQETTLLGAIIVYSPTRRMDVSRYPLSSKRSKKKRKRSMVVAKRKTQEVSWLCAYIGVLFASAIVRDFVIAPYVAQHASGIEAALVEPIWKLFFWIIPTFLYIQFVEGQNPLTYLKLSTNILHGLLWGLYGCFFVTALEFGNLLRNHTPHTLSTDTWINVILLVGFMEEIPFRGFLFQKLQSWFGFLGATLLSSLLFALIHLPLWISTGQSTNLPFALFLVFAVGILACIVLKMSESLWSSIIVHTCYNLLTALFV